jgi:hypothetical protein
MDEELAILLSISVPQSPRKIDLKRRLENDRKHRHQSKKIVSSSIESNKKMASVIGLWFVFHYLDASYHLNLLQES